MVAPAASPHQRLVGGVQPADQVVGHRHLGGQHRDDGLTFFALNGIQTEARMGDTRYARDLGLLLASNVTPLAAQGNDRELARVTEEFWRSSRSLRYIFYADPEGVIYLGIPISKVDSGNDLLLSRRLELPSDLRQRPQNP